MAKITIPMPEWGAHVSVECSEVLHTVAYPEIAFGNSAANAVIAKNLLQALSREVLSLRDRVQKLEG